MSGILGDEMGLGKTIQSLAIIQHLKETCSIDMAGVQSLVVCPMSVLGSWMVEASRYAPELKVFQFHGSASERANLKAQLRQNRMKGVTHDLVVTTYETLVAEEFLLARRMKWHIVIFDEGHKLKNGGTRVSRCSRHVKACSTFILTGTPLQNDLHELWSLFRLLYPEVRPGLLKILHANTA